MLQANDSTCVASGPINHTRFCCVFAAIASNETSTSTTGPGAFATCTTKSVCGQF